MSKSRIEKWLEEDTRGQKIYKQEELLFEVSEVVYELMAEKGLSAKELAKRLGVSKPRVSKMLDGSSNLTLRTLSDIGFALEKDIRIDFVDSEPCQQAPRAEAQWENTGRQSQLQLVVDNTPGETRHFPVDDSDSWVSAVQ
ncbi:MAG: helix-turn-helix transcriptional regulator [Cellvibrionaceae bacterium]